MWRKSRAELRRTFKNLESSQKKSSGARTAERCQQPVRRGDPKPNSCSNMETVKHQCQEREDSMSSNTKKVVRQCPAA